MASRFNVQSTVISSLTAKEANALLSIPGCHKFVDNCRSAGVFEGKIGRRSKAENAAELREALRERLNELKLAVVTVKKGVVNIEVTAPIKKEVAVAPPVETEEEAAASEGVVMKTAKETEIAALIAKHGEDLFKNKKGELYTNLSHFRAAVMKAEAAAELEVLRKEAVEKTETLEEVLEVLGTTSAAGLKETQRKHAMARTEEANSTVSEASAADTVAALAVAPVHVSDETGVVETLKDEVSAEDMASLDKIVKDGLAAMDAILAEDEEVVEPTDEELLEQFREDVKEEGHRLLENMFEDYTPSKGEMPNLIEAVMDTLELEIVPNWDEVMEHLQVAADLDKEAIIAASAAPVVDPAVLAAWSRDVYAYAKSLRANAYPGVNVGRGHTPQLTDICEEIAAKGSNGKSLQVAFTVMGEAFKSDRAGSKQVKGLDDLQWIKKEVAECAEEVAKIEAAAAEQSKAIRAALAATEKVSSAPAVEKKTGFGKSNNKEATAVAEGAPVKETKKMKTSAELANEKLAKAEMEESEMKAEIKAVLKEIVTPELKAAAEAVVDELVAEMAEDDKAAIVAELNEEAAAEEAKTPSAAFNGMNMLTTLKGDARMDFLEAVRLHTKGKAGKANVKAYAMGDTAQLSAQVMGKIAGWDNSKWDRVIATYDGRCANRVKYNAENPKAAASAPKTAPKAANTATEANTNEGADTAPEEETMKTEETKAEIVKAERTWGQAACDWRNTVFTYLDGKVTASRPAKREEVKACRQSMTIAFDAIKTAPEGALIGDKADVQIKDMFHKVLGTIAAQKEEWDTTIKGEGKLGQAALEGFYNLAAKEMFKKLSTPKGALQTQGFSLLMAGALRKETEGDIFLKNEETRKAGINALPLIAIHTSTEPVSVEETKSRGEKLQRVARDIRSDKDVLKAYRKQAAMRTRLAQLEGDAAMKVAAKLEVLSLAIAAVAFDETDVLKANTGRIIELLQAVETTKPVKEGLAGPAEFGALPCCKCDDSERLLTVFVRAVLAAEKRMPASYQYSICAVLGTPVGKLSAKVGEEGSIVRYAAWRSLELAVHGVYRTGAYLSLAPRAIIGATLGSLKDLIMGAPDGEEGEEKATRLELVKARLSTARGHLKNFAWTIPKAAASSLWAKITGLFKKNKAIEEGNTLKESDMTEVMKEESTMWQNISARLAKVKDGGIKVASWTKGFAGDNWKEIGAAVAVGAGAAVLGASALVAVGCGVVAGAAAWGLSKLWSWFKSDEQVAKRVAKKDAKVEAKAAKVEATVGDGATAQVAGVDVKVACPTS